MILFASSVVHDLFAGDKNVPSIEVNKIGLQHSRKEEHERQYHPIRKDFMDFLQSYLPGTTINFALETVSIHSSSSASFNTIQRSLIRPVLSIDIGYNTHISNNNGNHNRVMNLKYNEFPTSQHISLYKGLDVSSLTDNEEISSEEGLSLSEEYHTPPRSHHKTIDTMNAEWLLSVFLCKSSTHLSVDY